ncbi:MAG: GNAT family N-acetyltransferase [Anaerolineaceae bacterium]|nr:GNAT family N-acetyltransferase [Anaerolineaceae bacterium]
MFTGLPLALHPPNPAIRLRRARLTDADALHQTCWPERSFGPVYQLLSRANQYFGAGRGAGFVLLSEDENPIGFGQFTLWPTCAEISDLIVAETYRGQGRGTALIQHIAQEARRIGATTLEIGAALDNPRALALYHRLGFTDSHVVHLLNGIESVQYLRLTING